ncbi:hypothetical protein F5887DRAFT_919441 [Amanita rubescens]|nr:hypothetical protein F5887DRAFT_919441 [Amanita rubescens]
MRPPPSCQLPLLPDTPASRHLPSCWLPKLPDAPASRSPPLPNAPASRPPASCLLPLVCLAASHPPHASLTRRGGRRWNAMTRECRSEERGGGLSEGPFGDGSLITG